MGRYIHQLSISVRKRHFAEQPLQFVNKNGKVAQITAPTGTKIESWATWNKAPYIFTEFTVLSILTNAWDFYNTVVFLTNLVGKFPFSQLYMYDNEFRLELQVPSTPWIVIDTQLWSQCLYGVNTLSQTSHQQQQQYNKKTTRVDWPFCHCFAHSTGGCTHPSCLLIHICGCCRMYSHVTNNCLSKNQQFFTSGQTTQHQQSQQKQQGTKLVTNMRGVHHTYTTHGQQAVRATATTPTET